MSISSSTHHTHSSCDLIGSYSLGEVSIPHTCEYEAREIANSFRAFWTALTLGQPLSFDLNFSTKIPIS